MFTNKVLGYQETQFVFTRVLPWPFFRASFLLPNPFCGAGRQTTKRLLSSDAAALENRLVCSRAVLRCPFSAGPVGTPWCGLQRNWARSGLEYLVILTLLQLYAKTNIFCKVRSLFIRKTFTLLFSLQKNPTVAHSTQAEC